MTWEILVDKFREAVLALPGNLNRDVKTAVKKGWLSRRRQGRTYVYYITKNGIEFIESKISMKTDEE
ncbi:MAG: hypothetical protein DRN15_11385 [Thermoprotei archaeon]|nr:MAG: hypothetical protein DRN15_11385 [Thermoprotei archaeon]